MSLNDILLLFILMIISSLLSTGNAYYTCPDQPTDCDDKLFAAETFDTTFNGRKFDNGAIIRAIKRNDVDVAKCLLVEEVDLHFQEPDTKRTPLMYATEYGESTTIPSYF